MEETLTKESKCQHPISKQTIWRVWINHFYNAPTTFSKVELVLECECGYRSNLESKIGDDTR